MPPLPRGTAAGERKAYALLTVTAVLWGGNMVAGRFAVGHISPMALTSLRWGIVVAVLAAIAGPRVRREWPVLRRHGLFLCGLGTLGFTAYNALFYVGAHHTTALHLGLVQGVVPALVLVGALFAYGTPVRPLQVAGLVLAMAGVAAAVSEGRPDRLLRLDLNIGDLLALIAAILYAAYTVALRRRPAADPVAVFAALAFGAFVSSLPLLAWEVAAGLVVWPDGTGWAVMAYVAVFPSLVAQVFFMQGVGLIGPGRAGLFVNLVPVSAALFGVTLLGEALHLYHVAALALVLGGICLAEWAKPAA